MIDAPTPAVKVLKEHNPISEFDRHQMVMIGRHRGYRDWQTHEMRDSLGRPNNGGYTLWHVAICNAPDCKAEMIVALSPLIDHLAVAAYPQAQSQGDDR